MCAGERQRRKDVLEINYCIYGTYVFFLNFWNVWWYHQKLYDISDKVSFLNQLSDEFEIVEIDF